LVPVGIRNLASDDSVKIYTQEDSVEPPEIHNPMTNSLILLQSDQILELTSGAAISTVVEDPTTNLVEDKLKKKHNTPKDLGS